jgi:predicted metal-binding membrane protein
MPRNAGWLAAGLVVAALAAWAVSVIRMRGMDAGPGSDLGSVGWFLGIWVAMTVAMMLPSAAPAVLFFARVSRERAIRGDGLVAAGLFLACYLAVWTVFGLAAYGIDRLVAASDRTFLAWDRAGAYVAGGAIAVAGLYEWSPLKGVFLEYCRSPRHFLFTGWHAGRFGAMRMGCEHGAYCVGCCFGIMVVLFSVGVMSLVWMAVLTVVIFAEKVLPRGDRLTTPCAVGFVVFGVAVALATDHVPGLNRPLTTPTMSSAPAKSLPSWEGLGERRVTAAQSTAVSCRGDCERGRRGLGARIGGPLARPGDHARHPLPCSFRA